MKRFSLIFSTVLFVLSVASCQEGFILSKVTLKVGLDEGNTYMTGDSVVFHFTGDADNIVFYSGEVGHQYKYKDRYLLVSSDVELMRLTMNIQHRSGNDAQALEIYYTSTFEGLNLDDGEADVQMIKEMYAGGMQGWTKFPYEEHGVESGTYYTYVVDLDPEFLNGLCIAFYWNPSDRYPDNVEDPSTVEGKADTYWVNGSLELILNEVASYQSYYDLINLVGNAVVMNETEGTYYYQDRGDGSIQVNATTIAFQGGSYSLFEHGCEGWLFSYPTSFNTVDSDEGDVVKAFPYEQDDFNYTYYSPGTYLATFICTNANYLGGYRELVELELEISGEEMERPDDEGDDDDED